jgi:hypothetical protein
MTIGKDPNLPDMTALPSLNIRRPSKLITYLVTWAFIQPLWSLPDLTPTSTTTQPVFHRLRAPPDLHTLRHLRRFSFATAIKASLSHYSKIIWPPLIHLQLHDHLEDNKF